MLNILEADTKDFQKVVNNILIEVKPMRLRGKISDDFLGYVNKLRQRIADLEAKLAEKEIQLTFVKEELAKEEKGHLKQMMDFEKRCQEFYGSNERVIDVLDEVKSLADRLLENFMLSKEYQDRKFRGRKLIEYYPFVNAIDKLIKSLKGEK